MKSIIVNRFIRPAPARTAVAAAALAAVLAAGAPALAMAAGEPGAGSAVSGGYQAPTPQAALETLLGSAVGKPAVPASPQTLPPSGAAGCNCPNPGGRAVVTVQRGQGLDSIIRQHLAGSPLRNDLLREAVRQLNPQAVAPGPGYRILAGARLTLPTEQDQLQHGFAKLLAARAAAQRDDASDAGGHAAAAAARRGWVRYP